MSLRLTIIDDEFLTRSKSGAIWGRVYFESGDQFFPEQGWTDMVVPFSGAWLEAMVRIVTQSTSKETVWFMDGPFSVSLLANGNGLLEVRFIHKEALEQSTEVGVEDLLKDALSVGKRLLDICQQRGWQNDHDIKILAAATKQGAEALVKLRR